MSEPRGGHALLFSPSPGNIIDAWHFIWEDAADTYAALVAAWWAGGYAKD